MEMMYCWRCDREVAMLDEAEFEQLSGVLSQCLTNVKAFREKHSVPLHEVDLPAQYKPALDCYESLTGVKESNHEVLRHHRVSLYGPPCPSCGLPLRTPKASTCPKCGWSNQHE